MDVENTLMILKRMPFRLPLRTYLCFAYPNTCADIMESTLDKVSCSSESGKERLPSDTDSHHSVAIDDGNDGPQDAKDGDRKVTIADFVRFATVTDSMMNCIGILAACAAGASQPLMTIVR